MAEARNDVEAFRLWATSLGCPPEVLPNEDALKSVFKSPQRELFYTMMKRVRPRQEVEAFRRHKLLVEVEKLGGKDQLMIISSSRFAFLPEKLQKHLKILELRRKREESESRLEEYKKEYDMLASSLKMKNIQIIKVKHRNDVLKAKVDLLRLKSEVMNADIKKEKGYKAQLLKYMPVKINSKDDRNMKINSTVDQALKMLDEFYEFSNNSISPHELQTAKNDLWSKFRDLFSNVPNFQLFNVLLRLKEQQLQSIIELNKKNENSLLNNLQTTKDPMTPFDKELIKAKIELTAVVVQHSEAVKKLERIGNNFCARCNIFIIDFKKKVSEFNSNKSEEHIHEFISDYLLAYNSRTFLKAENDLIQQEIDQIRSEIQENAKKLQNHELLLGTVEQTYSDISAAVNSVQNGLMQLKQTKQKIIYSRNLLKFKLSDVQAPTKSVVPFNVDSFEANAENLLCSTRLDLDSSFAGAANTSISYMRRNHAGGDTNLLCNTESRNQLPPHSHELTIFTEIPLEKFSCFGKECAFYFAPNPLVIDSRELSSTLQLAPGTLLTQNAALQEVRNRIAWADLIALNSTDLKLDLKLDLTMVDVQKYKERSRAQRDRLVELFDKIETSGIRTYQTLQKASKVYNFILDNPLRHYIPPTKLFNNLTYAQFESEFKMYYRIATIGATIK